MVIHQKRVFFCKTVSLYFRPCSQKITAIENNVITKNTNRISKYNWHPLGCFIKLVYKSFQKPNYSILDDAPQDYHRPNENEQRTLNNYAA